MQQIISTTSLKELQRSSTFTTSPKWSEGYIWASVKDAGDWVNGEIRPTRSITGQRYQQDGSRAPTASCLWHIHHDAVFSLSSAYYHLSMLPGYGDHQPAAEEGEATAEGSASTGQTAGQTTGQTADQTSGQTADQQPTSSTAQPASDATPAAAPAPQVKWCLINVLINNDVVNAMSDPSTSEAFMRQNGCMPSRFNRRFTDYSVEIIYDGSRSINTINVSGVFHIKSIWGSTLPSPFIPSPMVWLASHVLDYSLISSNIWVYTNSILELSAHPTISSKLAYFAHNIFSKSISDLLINPAT
eukprot:2326670-Amphidinium_carterae.1